MYSRDLELTKPDRSASRSSDEIAEVDRLFDLSLEMLCIADTDGYFRRLNAAFQRTLGYELEELLARPFVEFVHQEDRRPTLDEVEKLSEGIPTVHFENRYRCKDGSYRWLAWTAMPEKEEGLIYATARDITDAKRSRELLRESEERFRTLADLSPAGIYLADPDGDCVYVNRRWCEMAGMEAGDAQGRGWVAAIHPDDRERVADGWYALVESRAKWELEYRIRTPDGKVTWVLGQAAALCDGEGGAFGYVGANTDITQRKRSEETLRRSEHRYQELLAAVTSYHYSVNFEDGLPASTEHTPGCLATTGYSPEEYASDPNLWIDMVHAEDRQAVRGQISDVLRNECVPPLEHRILHKDGRIRWVRNTVVAHFDDGGVLTRYDGLIEDITDRKRTEQRFKRLLESAPDAMVVVDDSGKIVLVNRQTEQVFGYSREELLGRSIEILVPERFRGRHPRQRADYAANPELRPMGTSRELHALRKDGSEFLAEIRLSPLDTEEGMLVTSAIRDITQRKKMEESLREREAQLLAARRIQQQLLPQKSPQVPGFDIAGGSYPADYVGGDYFDYLRMPDGSTGIVVADVTGHGLPAALLASSTHTLFRSLAHHHQELPEILTLANSILIEETEDDYFVTALLGRLDPKERSFLYASAGHPPAYLFDEFGDVKACLKSTAPFLALSTEFDFPTGGPYFLKPGEVLLLVTDGIFEAMSAGGEFFGVERMLEFVGSRRHLSAGEIVAGLYREVCEFIKPAEAMDDITAVVVKCLGG
jgi:sigma-B regulation protein RsbU (phosphoserine phosphatase)